MDSSHRILVAGARGMVGSAIVRKLRALGFENLLTPTSGDLDLKDARAVNDYLGTYSPARIFVAAAKVGGIHANDTFAADFIYDNLMMECNLIHGAHLFNVDKVLFLGSTCIYPRLASQPLKEESLLTGPLEPTNEWYAVAKIAGIKLCQAYRKQHGRNYICAMPTNLYGPNDSFDLNNSHVLPALLRKFHEAKLNCEPSVSIWGSGKPRREFLHVDDCADACIFLMNHYNEAEIVNIGVGEDIAISELAGLISRIVEYDGIPEFDATKPDGTPRKLVDTSKINRLGWGSTIALKTGIAGTYRWYQEALESNEVRGQ